MIKMANGNTWNFYSFATKYCSHHEPEKYVIYDKFVYKMLMNFKKYDKFHKFIGMDLKDYARFAEIMVAFRKFYSLEKYSNKEIDMYLWMAGKHYFK